MLETDISWASHGILRALPLVEVLLFDKTFDEMARFVMKAMREGILEDEIWATEVMSSKELQTNIAERLREIR